MLYCLVLGGHKWSDVVTLVVCFVLVGFGWPTVEGRGDIGSCFCIVWAAKRECCFNGDYECHKNN